MVDLKTKTVIAVISLAVLCCAGCLPVGQDLSAVKLQVEKLEARFKLAETIQAKIAEDVTATVDAKVDAKVDAEIELLSSKVEQQVGLLMGSQNLGMFAGGGIYVLILALVVVLAVIGGIVFLFWTTLKQKAKTRAKGLLANTLISAIASAKRKNGTSQIQAVLTEVKDQAEKAGIKQQLDRLLIERSIMD